MAADPDEEALSWSGETDPTHVAAPASITMEPSTDDDDDVARLSSALLVTFGILAGVYLLYAVGWGIHVFQHPVPVEVSAGGVFPAIMYQLGQFFSIASPFLWAGAVWLLVKRPPWRLLWLFVGAIVLVPLPFIMGN